MNCLKRDEDTICAISTARGTGGLSVIRISGDHAESVVRKLCLFLPKTCQSHRIYYGFIKSFEDEIEIDEVLVSYFAKGRSFTGEQTLEISSHGGNFISQKIIFELQKAGARIADRGEFTYRSFMNGRIDLAQAEGVLAMIESEGEASSRLALKQLKGELSQTFKSIEDRLTWILAHLEANIDFASEDIQYSSDEELLSHSLDLQTELGKILSTYNKGRQLREGVDVSIIGEPNVGKSSLFNALLSEDRAIVSAQAGTTRDYVEGQLLIDGVVCCLRDTAGLRDTHDEIEKLGMERSLKSARESDIIFLVLDLAKPFNGNIKDFIIKSPLQKLSFIFNKSDLISEREHGRLLDEKVGDILELISLTRISHKSSAMTAETLSIKDGTFSEEGCNLVDRELIKKRCFIVSAEDSTGISFLLDSLKCFSIGRYAEDSAIITQARHFELLKVAYERLSAAIQLLHERMSPEFVAFELQDSLVSIQQLLGKRYDDDVMDRVFKEFCLGK